MECYLTGSDKKYKEFSRSLWIDSLGIGKNHHPRKELGEGGHERNDSTTINYLARSSLLGGSTQCTLEHSKKTLFSDNLVSEFSPRNI